MLNIVRIHGQVAWIYLFSYIDMSLICIGHKGESTCISEVDVALLTCHMRYY